MQNLMHWFAEYENILAVLITIGVAVLLICCMECTDCSGREKDEIFHHHEV